MDLELRSFSIVVGGASDDDASRTSFDEETIDLVVDGIDTACAWVVTLRMLITETPELMRRSARPCSLYVFCCWPKPYCVL